MRGEFARDVRLVNNDGWRGSFHCFQKVYVFFAPSLVNPAFDIRHFHQKFPQIRSAPCLMKSVGQAITKRPEFLRYRERHRGKLASNITSEAVGTRGEQGNVLPVSIAPKLQKPQGAMSEAAQFLGQSLPAS